MISYSSIASVMQRITNTLTRWFGFIYFMIRLILFFFPFWIQWIHDMDLDLLKRTWNPWIRNPFSDPPKGTHPQPAIIHIRLGLLDLLLEQRVPYTKINPVTAKGEFDSTKKTPKSWTVKRNLKVRPLKWKLSMRTFQWWYSHCCWTDLMFLPILCLIWTEKHGSEQVNCNFFSSWNNWYWSQTERTRDY